MSQLTKSANYLRNMALGSALGGGMGFLSGEKKSPLLGGGDTRWGNALKGMVMGAGMGAGATAARPLLGKAWEAGKGMFSKAPMAAPVATSMAPKPMLMLPPPEKIVQQSYGVSNKSNMLAEASRLRRAQLNQQPQQGFMQQVLQENPALQAFTPENIKQTAYKARGDMTRGAKNMWNSFTSSLPGQEPNIIKMSSRNLTEVARQHRGY